jgi:hypothetical protein
MSNEQKKIRKTVGKSKNTNLLDRLYQLNQFIKSLGKELNYEPNIKPIRRTVGRTHKG